MVLRRLYRHLVEEQARVIATLKMQQREDEVHRLVTQIVSDDALPMDLKNQAQRIVDFGVSRNG